MVPGPIAAKLISSFAEMGQQIGPASQESRAAVVGESHGLAPRSLGILRPAYLIFLVSLVSTYFLSPERLTGQEESPAVAVFVTPATRLSQISGHDRLWIGGWGGFAIPSGWSFGGAAFVLPNGVTLPGNAPGLDLDLTAAYGGAIAKYRWLALGDGPSVAGQLLFGAGNLDIVNPATQVETDSDNFLVLEPEIFLEQQIVPHLALSLSGGYRFTFGVEDLPMLDNDALSGASISLGFRLQYPSLRLGN